MAELVDCNKCVHISISEHEQNKLKSKPDHMCKKHKVRVFHRDKHPKLIPCENCGGKDFDFE